MKAFKRFAFVMLGVAAMGLSTLSFAAKVGEPAPAFSVKGSDGKTYDLSNYKGKWVVLEWHNQNCPFVKSQYAGKMEKLQAKWTKKGVKWFSVISSASGMEGSVSAEQANDDVKEHKAKVTATLMDGDGTVGHAYGAKTTPHMFVIDPKGNLVYDGAIDNAPLKDEMVTKADDGSAYVNYVDKALKEGLAGKTITTATTVPYGCHVKYAN